MTRSANSAPPLLRACSACDGDYEDPERTAWREPQEGDDEDASNDELKEAGPRARFPVQEL